MIEQTVEEPAPIVGTRPACRALGASPATIYRRRRPPEPKPKRPRPRPARSLSEAERAAVLEALRGKRFLDSSPAQVWATLLDEGSYLCSERTMYRLLGAGGEVRERRDQLAAAAHAADGGVDQQARQRGGCSLNSDDRCLICVDRYRSLGDDIEWLCSWTAPFGTDTRELSSPENQANTETKRFAGTWNAITLPTPLFSKWSGA